MEAKAKDDRVTFDVKLTRKDIFSLLMNHSYFGPMGIVTGIIVIASVVLYVLKFNELDVAGRVILVAVFVIYLAINPLMLYVKAKSQEKASAGQKPITYEINDENILIGQGVKRDACPWRNIIKARETGSTLLLYVTKYTAFIWPKDQMGPEKTAAAKELIRRNVRASAVKLRK